MRDGMPEDSCPQLISSSLILTTVSQVNNKIEPVVVKAPTNICSQLGTSCLILSLSKESLSKPHAELVEARSAEAKSA
jgi:hypothetical protein